MLTTEDEAKTKRCHASFGDGFVGTGATSCVSVSNPYGSSASIAYSSPAMCIGAACMAWRWHWTIDCGGQHHHVNDVSTGKPFGYCGRAGRP